MKYIFKFNEDFYSEYESYFEHNGELYDLNKLIKYSNKNKVYEVNVTKLKWILKYTVVDKERVIKSDINIPILVTKIDKKYYIVDGVHRLKKALENNIEHIKAKFISQKILSMCKINKK